MKNPTISNPVQAAHTATIDVEMFRSPKWRKYVQQTARLWRNYYKEIIAKISNAGKNFHLLFYDALKIDKVAEMRRLYAFLQKEATDNFEVENISDRLQCIGEQNLEKYKRKKQEIDFDLFLSGRKLRSINFNGQF